MTITEVSTIMADSRPRTVSDVRNLLAIRYGIRASERDVHQTLLKLVRERELKATPAKGYVMTYQNTKVDA